MLLTLFREWIVLPTSNSPFTFRRKNCSEKKIFNSVVGLFFVLKVTFTRGFYCGVVSSLNNTNVCASMRLGSHRWRVRVLLSAIFSLVNPFKILLYVESTFLEIYPLSDIAEADQHISIFFEILFFWLYKKSRKNLKVYKSLTKYVKLSSSFISFWQ